MSKDNELKDCGLNPVVSDELQPASSSGLDTEACDGSGDGLPDDLRLHDIGDSRAYQERDPAVPPHGSVTRVWKTREDVRLPMSRPDESERNESTAKRRNGDPLDPRSMEIDRLLGCAYGASLFRNGEGVPFALIPGEATDQSDVAFLHSREFASFLREKYYAQYGRYPKDALLRIVRDLLDRRAYRGEAISAPVAPRVLRGVAERAGEPGQSQVFRPILALDLGRCSSAAPNSVLEIDADGWSVSHSNGFAFLRARGHLPVPPPERAGAEALAELKNLLRVDHDDWLRIVTWLLVAMRANGPYPILVLQGEPASGKTQAAKMLKSLLDPAAVPVPTTAYEPEYAAPSSQPELDPGLRPRHGRAQTDLCRSVPPLHQCKFQPYG